MSVIVKGPPGWVPVEHRWFGLDRRTFAPGLTALVIALLLIYGWQAVDAATPWRHAIKAGQVLDLGGGATAVPPVGWQLQSGTLVGGAGASATSLQIILARGGATIGMQGAAFTGSAAAFLAQVDSATGDHTAAANGSLGTVTTASGLVGVVRSSTGPSGDVLEAAFKMATGTGGAVDAAPALVVRVDTAPGQFEQYRDEVGAVLNSITPGASR